MCVIFRLHTCLPVWMQYFILYFVLTSLNAITCGVISNYLNAIANHLNKLILQIEDEPHLSDFHQNPVTESISLQLVVNEFYKYIGLGLF